MSTPFLGQITLFAGNFAPRAWAFCDGQLLAISSNSALFSILGTIYGGDGRTTFALPDLRGRAAIHEGRGPGLSPYSLGQRGGQESVTLLPSQMPVHSHTLNATNAPGDKGGPQGKMLAAGHGDETIYHDTPPSANIRAMASNSIANAGGGQSHNNIQPFLAINYIIALQGVYPSRN
ncbi:MAG: tail fiber protein [Litorimonas sp.]